MITKDEINEWFFEAGRTMKARMDLAAAETLRNSPLKLTLDDIFDRPTKPEVKAEAREGL